MIGRNIKLEGDRSPFAPCKYCGCCEGNIRPGAGPHKAQIRCNGCDRGLGWVSASMLEMLERQALSAETDSILSLDYSANGTCELVSELPQDGAGHASSLTDAS